ncbi:PPR domain-containing protein/PPR_2 domain-containing protein [Cephalotus follicularis]|uniref:PPR domain-containing protein/PPR_2 domain-containing protein n=1 Tax=Cephalotus follicularis TaxID=3775 RepID=A0A1Q3C9H8_CEPFO|nr:PPR domain-containing protein/PPR_2 domain-containing protein [Cephalotus follicularis]
MLGFYASHRVLKKPSKTCIKCMHSLHKSKPQKPISNKFTKKSKKPQSKNQNVVVEPPKVYMRDTISNIHKILKYSTWDSAQNQLEKLPISKWDSYTINQVLKTHPPMEKAWLFFNWASHINGFKHDQFTCTTMMDIFGEAKRVSSMKHVFKLMQEKGIKVDTVTYTSLMHWLSKSADVEEAIKVWEEMKDKGCYPTVVSYTAYMKILFDDGRAKEASDVYKEMIQSGISPNCHTYTVLMEYLAGSGKYEEALEIFNKMQEAAVKPDKATCNILVEKCCKAGETKTMIQILHYMKENGLVLRYPIFMEALKTLNVSGESDALLRQVNPHISLESISDEDVDPIATGADDPSNLDRGLIVILLKKHNLVAVNHLLAGMVDKNLKLDSVTISTIIEVNCAHHKRDDALLAFQYSINMDIKLRRTAYLALIGILIRTNTFPKVVEIVKEMTKAGHSLGVYTRALLIYRLGCARRPVCAAKIFSLLPDDQKCTATYTALIGVHFAAGSANKALKTYKSMQRTGKHPSLGTYNVLLSGLEISGRFSEAETCRKEKKNLQNNGRSDETVSMDEKICDILFAGDMVS